MFFVYIKWSENKMNERLDKQMDFIREIDKEKARK